MTRRDLWSRWVVGPITDARVWLFGVALAPVQGVELVVVHHEKHARHLGFDARGRHPQARHLRTWWPDLGDHPLRGLVIQRVTIPDHFPLTPMAEATLRSRMMSFRDKALWLRV